MSQYYFAASVQMMCKHIRSSNHVYSYIAREINLLFSKKLFPHKYVNEIQIGMHLAYFSPGVRNLDIHFGYVDVNYILHIYAYTYAANWVRDFITEFKLGSATNVIQFHVPFLFT